MPNPGITRLKTDVLGCFLEMSSHSTSPKEVTLNPQVKKKNETCCYHS